MEPPAPRRSKRLRKSIRVPDYLQRDAPRYLLTASVCLRAPRTAIGSWAESTKEAITRLQEEEAEHA
eukprot:6174902-Pleurochrysis_carterae.AAC.4